MPASTTMPSARRLHASSSGTAGRRDPLAGTYRGGEATDLDAGQFIQMEAAEGDDGVWTEPPIITRAKALHIHLVNFGVNSSGELAALAFDEPGPSWPEPLHAISRFNTAPGLA